MSMSISPARSRVGHGTFCAIHRKNSLLDEEKGARGSAPQGSAASIAPGSADHVQVDAGGCVWALTVSLFQSSFL